MSVKRFSKSRTLYNSLFNIQSENPIYISTTRTTTYTNVFAKEGETEVVSVL